jgi:hypothetical protein
VSKPVKDRDFATIARGVVEKAIGEHLDGTPLEVTVSHKSAQAVARGRLGGLKGGKLRARRLSAKRRKAIAVKAAKARWKARRLIAPHSLDASQDSKVR